VTFASSFAEGYELVIFSLILSPVIKEFSLTVTGVVLLASVPMAAGLVGYLFMGWLMDVMGRKPTLVSTYVICMCGCALMATAPDVYQLGLGRGIIALGIRSGITCVSVYMSELSPAEHRGMLVSMEEVYINLGMLAATLMAWVLMGRQNASWRTFVTLGGIAPALALLALLCLQVPESPRYLQLWGRHAEAAAVLRSALDGKDDEIEQTLSSWREEEETMTKTTWADQLSQVLELPGHAGFRIACCCWISRAGSGIVVIGTYFAVFMKEQGMDDESALRWFTAGQLAKTVALALPVLWLIDACGRRALFLASAAACCASTALAAALRHGGFPAAAVAWCVVAYWASFSLGYGPVVWVYCFEILPRHQRGRAATVSMLFGDVAAGVLLISAPYLVEIDAALPYAVIAVTNFAAMVFFYAACPETAGMILEHAGNVGASPRTAVARDGAC